ncbi:MAG: CinA family protein [Nitrospirae bacterium]|nr:CinA family protein [Nitrospirota bacterium]
METHLEIVGKLHEAFKSKGLRLSIAESCTGGLISHWLTTLPGASLFFDSSIVSYSINSKIKLLGVKKSTVKKHGTISEETAREMAESLRSKTGTDFCLSITGNLGPEPIEDKKVGLVFIAVSFSKETTSRGFRFEGSRDKIKKSAGITALEFLYEAVSIWT